MKVYILDADVNNYRGIFLEDEEKVVELNRRFNGTPMKNSWSADERFRFIPENLPRGDTPGLSTHIPVFNSKAVQSLRDLLSRNGELLPITCEGENYWLFNVTRIVKALDEFNCDIERFSDGRIMFIDQFSFYQDKLVGINLFKVPQLVLRKVFVTDLFVKRVKEANLKGFKFGQVWSSD